MNISQKINYLNARIKIKLYDNKVRKKSLDIKVIRLEVQEDRYGDKEYTIIDHGIISAIIKIPGGDLQAFQGSRQNNDYYNLGVSVYSLLPIEAWTTSDSLLNKDDILLFKILRNPLSTTEQQETFIQALQVSNVLSRATNIVLYNKYYVAPYTFNLQEYPQIETILNQYKMEPIIL
jgi:hypothetical protein